MHKYSSSNPPPSEATRIGTLKKKTLLNGQTLNAWEGDGNGTTKDNLILNPHRSAQSQFINPPPSQAMRIGTRRKKYNTTFQPSMPRKVLEMELQ